MKYTTTSLSYIFFIWLSVMGCTEPEGSGRRIVSLYSNASFSKVEAEDPRRIGITRHIAKVHNKHSQPIVIPIDYFHQWSVTKVFSSEIEGDSLVHIAGTGAPFFSDLGVDTLYPGETQRYFVNLYLNYPREPGTYSIIEFRYFFLDDFSERRYDYRFAQEESFILYLDSTEHLHIHNTVPGFDSKVHVSHPLPKSRR